VERRGYEKNQSTMNNSLTQAKPEFLSGWRLALFRLKFAFNSLRYIFQRKKYPLFLIKSLRLAKGQGLPEKVKIVKFANQYYAAILRIPHWPSKPFDRMIANGGFNINASGTRFKQHIDSVILAITRRCNLNCKHCYEYWNLAEKDSVPVERWKGVIKDLQKTGVSIIVLSGGEPMLRYEGLIELLDSGDKNLSDFHVHTSGKGVTLEKAIELKTAGLSAAGIGLDDFNPERQDEFRGHKGAHQESIQAIQHFREAGVFPYVNMCLRRELIRGGGLWTYFEFVKDLNAGFIVLLEPKPWGRYHSANAGDLFSEEDRKIVTDFFEEARHSKKYKDYPLIFYAQYFERPEHLGCLMGGLSHLYINSLGNVQPCVFLPVSFGSIMEEDFLEIYKRIRKAVPAPLHEKCPSVYLAETIKNKKNQGSTLPIAYKEIEREWEQMFASALYLNPGCL
jgi:MoaA/NifB/PqqE/SkfB family radical SAM enzyme